MTNQKCFSRLTKVMLIACVTSWPARTPCSPLIFPRFIIFPWCTLLASFSCIASHCVVLIFHRNARGFIEPEPAGFTDLFAPNTSSIMSVASSTPGRSDRCITTNNNYTSSKPLIQQQQQQQQEEVEGSSSSSNVIAGRGGGGGIAGGITKIRRSLERSGAGGGGGYGHGHNDDTDAGVASGREARGVGHGGHEDNSAVRMPPLAPRGGGGGGGRAGRAGLRSDWSEQETGEKRHDGNYDDGDGYDAEEEARAEEGIDGEDEAMVVAYAESPVIVRRRVGRVGLGGEEGVGSAAAAASLAPLTASATKRKRRPDADGNGNNGDPYDHVRRGARGNVNVPAWESERELAAERTRWVYVVFLNVVVCMCACFWGIEQRVTVVQFEVECKSSRDETRRS